MDRVHLLQALKVRQTEDLKDILLPTKPSKEVESVNRMVEIFTGRLPDRKSETQKAPYIVNSILNSTFKQEPGQRPASIVTVRSTLCVYQEDGEKGTMAILNLLERMRISYQKDPILDGVFELDMTHGVEDLVYPDDTAPFYMADQVTVWKLPPVVREVRPWLT